MTKTKHNGATAVLEDGKSQKIECFICKGKGELQERDILMKLGGEDLLNLLKMNKEQFFEALEDNSPALFEQIAETLRENYSQQVQNLEERHRIELERTESKAERLLERIAELKTVLEEEKIARTELETKQKSVPSLKGMQGEKDFEEWIGQYSQFECSEKLPNTGDYIVNVKKHLPNGDLVVNAEVLVDNKKDKKIAPDDEKKLFGDCNRRKIRYAYILVESKEQFRAVDHTKRVFQKDGIWLFKGDYGNFLDDMAFLPFFADVEKLGQGEELKAQKERLHQLILSKVQDLEEFKKISAAIARERGKIDQKVDEMRQQIKEQLEEIMGGT